MSENEIYKIQYENAYKRFNNDLLTPDEAREYLRISRTTLDKLKSSEKGLKHVKLGKKVRFPLADLVKFSMHSQQ